MKTLCGFSIGETTLLNFDLTRGEWKVTSVVKDDQLGKPEESMKEKMERLFTQPTQTPTRAAEGVVSLEEQPRREGEQAKEAKEREESMRRVETFELLKKTGAPPQSVPPVPQRGDKPKFHHLKLFKGKDGNTIRVIKTDASKWDEVAYSLHFKRQVVNTISRDDPQDESACEEVLDRWLSGDLTTRQPVTWATLIQSLRDYQQNSLAEDLERGLFS